MTVAKKKLVTKSATRKHASSTDHISSRRTVSKRPAKRKIVRWNEDLDKKLLLAIQSACNTLGVKIPWTEVAELMGHDISDGAIVQHLAKLRVRMINAGLDVPPPLRRGGTAPPSKISRSIGTPKGTRSKGALAEDDTGDDFTEHLSDNLSEDSGQYHGQTAKRTVKARKPLSYREGDSGQGGCESDAEFVAAGATFLDYPSGSEKSTKVVNGLSCTNAVTSPMRKLVKLQIPRRLSHQVFGVGGNLSDTSVGRAGYRARADFQIGEPQVDASKFTKAVFGFHDQPTVTSQQEISRSATYPFLTDSFGDRSGSRTSLTPPGLQGRGLNYCGAVDPLRLDNLATQQFHTQGQNIVSNASNVYYQQTENPYQHAAASVSFSNAVPGEFYGGIVPWGGETEPNFGTGELNNVDSIYLNRAVHSDSYEDILNDVVDGGYDLFGFGGK